MEIRIIDGTFFDGKNEYGPDELIDLPEAEAKRHCEAGRAAPIDKKAATPRPAEREAGQPGRKERGGAKAES